MMLPSMAAHAQSVQIMSGPDIDVACGGSGLTATVAQMSSAQQVSPCVPNSNYCQPMSVRNYTIRCDGGTNAGKQLSGVDVWWAAYGSRNTAKFRIVNGSASTLVAFKDVIAGERTGWLTLPAGTAPISPSTRIETVIPRTVETQVDRGVETRKKVESVKAPEPAQSEKSGVSIFSIIMYAILGFIALIVGTIVQSVRRSKADEAARLIQAERDRQARAAAAIAEEAAKAKQAIVSMTKQIDTSWSRIEGNQKNANAALSKAEQAFKDNRIAGFYENLWTALESISDAREERSRTARTLESYNQGRIGYGMAAHPIGPANLSINEGTMKVLYKRAIMLYETAERLPQFVQIRLQMEANRAEKQFHTDAAYRAEQELDAAERFRGETLERYDQMAADAERRHEDQLLSDQVNAEQQILAMSEAAERLAEEQKQTVQPIKDQLHDIHRHNVPDDPNNRYKR